MEKQVDKTHYEFHTYINKRRWASMWHQLDEVISDAPEKVLEIGPGPGIIKALAGLFGVQVETLDLDPDLSPDYVASANNMPFEDNSYELTCAFQMLEHVPYKTMITIFQEMVRVTSKKIVISLPNAQSACPFSLYIPKKGDFKFYIKIPSPIPKEHIFDGQHYWEINKKGYSEKTLVDDLLQSAPVNLIKSFRVKETPYHHFLIFKKQDIKT